MMPHDRIDYFDAVGCMVRKHIVWCRLARRRAALDVERMPSL